MVARIPSRTMGRRSVQASVELCAMSAALSCRWKRSTNLLRGGKLLCGYGESRIAYSPDGKGGTRIGFLCRL